MAMFAKVYWEKEGKGKKKGKGEDTVVVMMGGGENAEIWRTIARLRCGFWPIRLRWRRTATLTVSRVYGGKKLTGTNDHVSGIASEFFMLYFCCWWWIPRVKYVHEGR